MNAKAAKTAKPRLSFAFFAVFAFFLAAPAAQVTFEKATADLTSADASTRFRAAQMLKEAAYPESAVPLAKLVTDPQDEVQLEAIAAELNIFLAEKIVVRKRVGFVVEVRNQIVAQKAFASGPQVIGPRPVPMEVLSALRTAAADENPRVALEAIYAFGTLAVQPGGASRREMLHAAAPALAALTGAPEPARRYAALRVIGRVFEQRRQDEPVDQSIGDAVIALLNEKDRALKVAAMQALGAMRYERSVQALIELFQYYGKGDEAAAALDALARIGHASAVPLFTAQLQTRNAPLRGIAIEGLARMGDRARLGDIQSAIGGERDDAVLLAGAFGSAMLANAPIESITEALARPKLHDQARQYLVELVQGRPTLLTRQAQDPDARIRADVADVLGLAGDPAALPLAESLSKDTDPQVARAAERAVARLRAAGS
jgi:HEAT repeat protein